MTDSLNHDVTTNDETADEVSVFDLTSESVDSSALADDDADLDADLDEFDDADTSTAIHPWNLPGQWFVVHTQAGYEKKVVANLNARVQSMNMEDRIFDVVVPMEEVVEFKGGRKQTVQKKVFPGYILVRCVMDDESWY